MSKNKRKKGLATIGELIGDPSVQLRKDLEAKNSLVEARNRDISRLEREINELGDSNWNLREDIANLRYQRQDDGKVERLKNGLRAARDKLVEQQNALVERTLKLQQLTSAPFIIATVFAIFTRRFRPEAGARIKVINGEHRGKTLVIGDVVGTTALCIDETEQKPGPQEMMNMMMRGESPPQPTIYEIDWGQVWGGNWRSVMEPADGQYIKKMVTVSVNGQFFDVQLPSDLKLKKGQQVKLHSESMQITDAVKYRTGGTLATVSSILDKHMCEVEFRGDGTAVEMGRFAPHLKAGDRVQLDDLGKLIVHVYRQPAGKFDHTQETSITWDMVGGQEEAKSALQEAIVLPYEQADLFSHYGQTPPKGVLLWGPPGTGKTILAKAVSTEIARRHGSSAKGAFIYVKGSEILNQWLGNSEAMVRKLFDQARSFKQKHGFPAVLCFDEAEAVMRRRGGDGRGSSFMDTLVPAFLAEMDGMTDSGAIVILMTNRPDVLDPAITRDGRIDRKIEVKRPNISDTEMIFRIHLRNLPVANGTVMEDLAKTATELLFSDENIIKSYHTDGGNLNFTLKGLRSGSLVEGIVKSAKASAIRRDIESGKMTGLMPCDIKTAIYEKLRENEGLDHQDAVEEFFTDFPPVNQLPCSETTDAGMN